MAETDPCYRHYYGRGRLRVANCKRCGHPDPKFTPVKTAEFSFMLDDVPNVRITVSG